MKIKRFAARDLTTATHMIKNEFGLSAIILSQREVPAEEGGGVEITAGVRDEDLPGASASEAAPASPAKPRAGQAAGAAAYRRAEKNISSSSEDIYELKQRLETLAADLGGRVDQLKELILDLAHRQSLAEKWRDRSDLVRLYRRLVDSALAPAYCRELVESAADSAQAWGGDLIENLRKTMQSKIRIADLSLSPPKALALVGPSGAGKTANLVNLAAFYRQRGLKAAAISLDTLRLGAAEQLTQYARILGLGVRVCQNHQDFGEALELFNQNDIILIDTPSRGFQREEGRQELTAYLNEASASVLLVLPATMKEADLKLSLSRARLWKEAGLVLSKFDETENLGDLMGFIISQAPRLAFLCLGPKTSEDFVQASADKILDLWLGRALAEEERQGRFSSLK